MRQGWRLLCAPPAATLEGLVLDVEAVAQVLGSDAYTTRQRLVGTGVRALLRGDDAAVLDEKRSALRALGLESVLHAYEARREPVRIRSVEPRGDVLVFHGGEALLVGEMAPGTRWLMVPVDVPSPHEVLQGRPLPAELPAEAALDLVDEAGQWFRIRLQGFNYARFEAGGLPSVAAQIGRLVRRFEACGTLTHHLGYPTNFGRPADPEEVRDYALRAHALWRAGLLAEGPARVAALAPVAPLTRARLGLDPAGVVPMRRRARSRLVPTPGLDDAWLGGAITALAVGWLLALLSPDIGFRGGRWLAGGLLLLGGIVGLGLGFVALRRWQHVADTPTSRARSVAMGLARLAGTVEPEVPLVSPWGHAACAWYEVVVERQARAVGVADEAVPFALRMIGRRRFARRMERWQTVVEGDSGDLPFRLRDETGAVRIDPTGATWLGCAPEVHYSEVRGETWRVTERTLPLGAALVALGTVDRAPGAARTLAVRTAEALRRLKQDPVALARYDLDGNGRIDEDEWNRARRAVEKAVAGQAIEDTETQPVVRRGADGVLVLSEHGAEALRRRLGRTVLVGTGLGLLAVLGALFLFWSAR